MTVYVRGNQVRRVDWTVETSRQFLRREYYFDDDAPRLAVETIHAKLGPEAETLAKPRVLSMERYRLDGTSAQTHGKELLDHANFLVDDFKKHRKSFSPCSH